MLPKIHVNVKKGTRPELVGLLESYVDFFSDSEYVCTYNIHTSVGGHPSPLIHFNWSVDP